MLTATFRILNFRNLHLFSVLRVATAAPTAAPPAPAPVKATSPPSFSCPAGLISLEIQKNSVILANFWMCCKNYDVNDNINCIHIQHGIYSYGSDALHPTGPICCQCPSGLYFTDFSCISVPNAVPTPSPSAAPTPSPSAAPTPSPFAAPTPSPTHRPTPSPTHRPTPTPSAAPTGEPSAAPTPLPSAAPTAAPSRAPFLDVVGPLSPVLWPPSTLRPSKCTRCPTKLCQTGLEREVSPVSENNPESFEMCCKNYNPNDTTYCRPDATHGLFLFGDDVDFLEPPRTGPFQVKCCMCPPGWHREDWICKMTAGTIEYK